MVLHNLKHFQRSAAEYHCSPAEYSGTLFKQTGQKNEHLQWYPENCRHRVTQFAKVLLTLHYCKHCKVHGHRPIDKRGRVITSGATKGACHITPEVREEFEARFARMGSWGLRTTATGGRWGLRVSDEHRCSPTGEDWSDTDEE